MKVLVACEESQAVCIAFRNQGHEAYSCDLQECSGGHPEWHIKGDAREVAYGGMWDLMIAHPPCTYLTNSAEWAYGDGPYHQKVKPGTLVGQARREAREESLKFVADLLNAPILRKCIENPIGQIGRRIYFDGSRWAVYPTKTKRGIKSQIVQPWQFGDDASKATALYLVNLPPLRRTRIVAPRIVDGKKRWGNQTDGGQNRLPPTHDRAKIRSKTYAGIAEAMAQQWSRSGAPRGTL
jgi:hypothetical protein